MEKSKLLDIYRSIKEEEWRDLIDFVNSPYFNKNEEVVQLCLLLRQLSKRNYPSKKLSTELIWKQLFPQKAYSKKELAYIMSRLLKLTEQFLGDQLYHKKTQQVNLDTLTALANRRLDKSYRRLLGKFKTALHASDKNDQEHFRTLAELAEIENFHFNQQNQRVFNPHLGAKNDALDQYFQLSKLSLFCDMLNQKRILSIDQQFSWPNSPFDDTLAKEENQVLNIYKILFNLLHEPSENKQLFETYISTLPSLSDKISDTELIRLYYFSINYCLYEINRGKREYATALLEIYQNGLKNENLLIAGELSPWIFKNMVKLGLGLRQYKWVENIIQNYSNKLPLDQQKDAFSFNMADLAYHQKNYDQALVLLNQVDFKDPFYKHGAKTMLLKIYFENQESEAFYSLSSSYRIMLLRDQTISENANTAYANFNRLITKLYSILSSDKKAIMQFEKNIQRAKSISDKQWLMQQLKIKKRG